MTTQKQFRPKAEKRVLSKVGLSAFSAALVMSPPAIFAQTSPNSDLLVPLHPAFHGNIAGLAWTILLVGFVTASFVQWAKDLLGLRSGFHRLVVRNWLQRRAEDPNTQRIVEEIIAIRAAELHPEWQSGASPSRFERDVSEHAEKQLENLLAPSGDDRPHPYHGLLSFIVSPPLPVYSLPAEQLCGQLASAAEAAVAAPREYPDLFAAFTVSGKPVASDAVQEFLAKSKTRMPGGDDQIYADLRAQLMMRAQRSLDNLQILIGQRWRRVLTATCLCFSFAFAVIVVIHLFGADPDFKAATFFKKWDLATVPTLIVAIAGALMAPLAHDLTLAIRSFRRP